MTVAAGVAGAVIVAGHPRDRIGWLFCAIGSTSALYAASGKYADYVLFAAPGALPGGSLAACFAT